MAIIGIRLKLDAIGNYLAVSLRIAKWSMDVGQSITMAVRVTRLSLLSV
jgi:hypothetical protein